MPHQKKVHALFFAIILAILVACAFFFWPKTTKGTQESASENVTKVVAHEDPDAWLEGADIRNGHNLSRICVACHTFDEGGPKRFAPNLFGIVGARYAHDTTYNYSPALKALNHKTWTTKDLDKWIENPAGFVPGTNMLFNGLNDPRHRRDLVAYMKSLK